MSDEPRRSTPVPFSLEEATSIREAIATPGVEVLDCPRCGELLTVTRLSKGEIRALSCERCRCILVLRREQ
jgi:uncharacterized paraquat-inducible protein A